jgi:uncharacterized protein YndB with AHSA1/START domain
VRVDEIRRELVIDAPIERVWEALTSAEQLRKWFGDIAEIDLRPGGRARFGWTEYDSVSEAIVDVVDAPTRFVFRWEAVDTRSVEEVSTSVEVTLEPLGDGTRPTMVESGFSTLPDGVYDRAFQANTSGWTAELKDLTEYLEKASSVG